MIGRKDGIVGQGFYYGIVSGVVRCDTEKQQHGEGNDKNPRHFHFPFVIEVTKRSI